jgi:hypothetical protein
LATFTLFEVILIWLGGLISGAGLAVGILAFVIRYGRPLDGQSRARRAID